MSEATSSGAAVVRRFFESMEARDWAAAAACLHEDVDVWWPDTRERFVGPNFLALQRAYPDRWHIDVRDVVEDADTGAVVAEVVVDMDDERFWLAGFYELEDAQIRRGVELWVTEGSEAPPDWRAKFRAG